MQQILHPMLLSVDMDDTKRVSNYPQSEIDRAQNAVKMSAKI